MSKTIKITRTLTLSLTLFLLIFSGCGNDSSSASNTQEDSSDLVVGVFMDSAVGGLTYRCSSGTSGVTNALGEFTCKSGDTIKFSLAHIPLPEVEVAEMITPYTLYPDNESAALNVAQLLQTLDKDENLSNGIDIDEDILPTLTEADLTSPSFDDDIQRVLGSDRTLVDEDEAKEHLDEMILATSSNGETSNFVTYALINQAATTDFNKITNASYLITSSSAPDGKDPDGNIDPGKIISYDVANKGFTLTVNRELTKKVATWWSSNIKDEQSTFNNSPNALYFATLGTVKLDITQKGDGWSDSYPPYTFKEIAFAMGKSAFKKNWWYGGKNCNSTKSYVHNKVVCTGTDANGGEVSIAFFRGGNNHNTVDIMPVNLSSAYNTASWMSQLDPKTTLSEIVMPGSHDAGMSKLHECYKAASFAGKGITKTQSLSVVDQLKAGSRYFDIRPATISSNDSLVFTYHGDSSLGGGGCYGEGLDSILPSIVNFLKNNPTEIAILNISHIRKNSQYTKDRLEEILKKYDESIYRDSENKYGGNLAKFPLSEIAGKIIILNDYDKAIVDPSKGRFSSVDGEVKIDDNSKGCSGDDPKDCECKYIDGSNLSICNNYSNKTSYKDMAQIQIDRWGKFGGLGQDKLFLLSWTVTGVAGGHNLERHAAEANYHLPSELYKGIFTNNYAKPNIVYVDFMQKGVAQNIIQYNFK